MSPAAYIDSIIVAFIILVVGMTIAAIRRI